MSNFKIETQSAVNELNKLIDGLNKLKTASNKAGTGAVSDFKALKSYLLSTTTSYNDIIQTMSKMSTAYNNLSKSQRSYVTQAKNAKEANALLKDEIKILVALLDIEEQKVKALTTAHANKTKKLTEEEKMTNALARAEEKLAAMDSAVFAQLIKVNQQMAIRTAELKKSMQPPKTIVPALTEEEKMLKKIAVMKERLRLANTQEYAELIKITQALKAKNAELNKTVETQKKATSGFGAMINSVKSLIVAFGIVGGIQLFANVVRDTFNLIKDLDSLRFSMEKITKTSIDYSISNRFLMQLTQDYGVALVATTERWIKFLAAAKQSGITLRETENIFRSMTKAGAVLGLKTHELSGIYLALEQMLSKGKVTTEELRRQLGERLPGAMGIMADSMGISIVQLDKMLKKGQVLSAEVLPAFADAVEIAFGLESVEKVETLVSAQERLSTAWSNFVKAVITDSSLLQGAFDVISKSLTGMALFVNDDFLDDFMIVKWTKEMGEDILKDARELVDKRLGIQNWYLVQKELLNKKEAEIFEAEKIKNNKTEVLRLQQQYADLFGELKKYNEEVLNEQKNYAYANIQGAEDEYKAAQKALDDNLQAQKTSRDKYKKEVWGMNIYTNLFEFVDAELETAEISKQEKGLREKLQLAEAYYEVVKKLTEPNPDPLSIDDPAGNSKIRLKNLRDEKDFEKEIQIGKLKSVIEFNQARIDSDDTYYKEKMTLARENATTMEDIYDLEAEIAIDAVVWKIDEEKAINAKAFAEGKIAVREYNDWLFDVNERRGEELILIEQELASKKFQNTLKLAKEQLALQDDGFSRETMNIKTKYDLQISEENKFWDSQTEAYKKNEKNKEAHEERLRKIQHESTQEQLKLMLKLLEMERDLMEANGDNLDNINSKIAILKAGIKDFDPKDTLRDLMQAEMQAIQDLLSMLDEFAQAVGDVFDAISERKIENIEAEIQAESDKYDKLIALEGNNKTAQLALEKEKADKLAILEKKKLKEEQKQARIRKAFAVADIATKLAQTIVAIRLAAMAQNAITPQAFGSVGAFFQAIQIPLAIATAVAQTAAVLAQPIPQYADGGIIKKDHKGIINDAVAQEYVERDNSILTTKNKNAIVNLKSGDIVHKDFDALQRNSMIMSGMLNGNSISENDFNRLFDGIENSIDKGFKKAKIQNVIRIINKTSNNSSTSRWN